MATLSRVAPEIPVQNLRSSIEFYEHKLGFTLAMAMPAEDYAIVERDGVAIHLFADTDRSHGPAGMHIFTDELDELESELRGRGAVFTQATIRKPWGNREFRVSDESGNELKFTEPVSE